MKHLKCVPFFGPSFFFFGTKNLKRKKHAEETQLQMHPALVRLMWPQKEQTGKVIVNRSLIKAMLVSSSVTLRIFCDLSGLQFHPLLIQHMAQAWLNVCLVYPDSSEQNWKSCCPLHGASEGEQSVDKAV